MDTTTATHGQRSRRPWKKDYGAASQLRQGKKMLYFQSPPPDGATLKNSANNFMPRQSPTRPARPVQAREGLELASFLPPTLARTCSERIPTLAFAPSRTTLDISLLLCHLPSTVARCPCTCWLVFTAKIFKKRGRDTSEKKEAHSYRRTPLPGA